MSATSNDHTVVVGGAGAVGSMFVNLLRTSGRSVTIVDPAQTSDGLRGDVTRPSPAVRTALASADVIILAVSEGVALAALPILGALGRSDALIVDTLSVKSHLAARLRRANHGGRELLGLNPMFRPSLRLDGRCVIAVPYVDGPRSSAFLADLRLWGASVAVMDADRHDRLAAATQALTHAAVLAFGLALAELDVAIDDLIEVGPPPLQLLLALLARIAGGEPEVYWDVQAGNPYASATRGALSDANAQLNVAADDLEAFATLMKTTETVLGDKAEEMKLVCQDIFERIAGVHRD